MNTILSSPKAREAVSIGFKNHWRFKVVSPLTYKDQWVTETVTEVPETAQDRIETLRSHGIPIKGFVIAHEAPRLLSAPKAEEVKHPKTTIDVFPLVETIFFVFYFLSQMLIQGILLDPALIVVLEDGTWLEVMTWYE